MQGPGLNVLCPWSAIGTGVWGLVAETTRISPCKLCSVIWPVVLAIDPPQGPPVFEAWFASLPHDRSEVAASYVSPRESVPMTCS